MAATRGVGRLRTVGLSTRQRGAAFRLLAEPKKICHVSFFAPQLGRWHRFVRLKIMEGPIMKDI